MKKLPLDTSGTLTDYTFTTDLDDGLDLQYRLSWSRTSEMWTLDILRMDGSPIAQGIVLVTTLPLLVSVTAKDRPSGELRLIRSDDSVEAPGVRELGTVAQLYYILPGEL